jgi:hypothetical protein
MCLSVLFCPFYTILMIHDWIYNDITLVAQGRRAKANKLDE